MDNEILNTSIRKFLKVVGVNSQRSIEDAVRTAVAEGSIAGVECLPALITLEIAGLRLSVRLEGEIRLQ